MLGAVAASTALCFSPSTHPTRTFVHRGVSNSTLPLSNHGHSFSLLSSTPMHFSSHSSRRQPLFLAQAASSSGYREKVFAIIGVKVYAAGLYLDQSITPELNAWKGLSKDAIQGNSSLFQTIFQSSFEKSLQIILVRDVDGQTFWDALSDAIAPRIPASTSVDETALTTFRGVFLDRPLKKGTFILLTWLNPTKLLVSVSPNGFPSTVDATIESANVASALFNVFLGDNPVSHSLKSSVAEGLSKVLK
ncbi:Fatty-acid-binding protein [Vigna angularis]|uniref:Chalcone-flavonone isomerase family protein n=1 Tax=Phaseolus angularis TaxID=3914 RepID=A0A8T0JJF0_PHAAN|nr:Fatty-acid-binding protein [Vigna angularis]